MGNSVVDDSIEFVASQGESQPNYKCGDGDGVRMDTQRQERIDALEKLVSQPDRTIKLLCTRLSFVMSMLGISDEVSLSHKEIIELDNNEEFPYLSAVKDPITKSISTSNPFIPPASKDMSNITGSSGKDAQNVFSNAVLKAVYHENKIKHGGSKCIVVSGLPVRSDQSDTTSVEQLCSKELQIAVNIAQCKRLGTEAASSPSIIKPILVTLSTVDQANKLISSAKKLRLSSDKAMRSGVYINRFMTKAESQAAYDLLCKRRSAAYTSTVAGSSGSSILSNYSPTTNKSQSANKHVLIIDANTVETLLSSSTSSSSAPTATFNPTTIQYNTIKMI